MIHGLALATNPQLRVKLAIAGFNNKATVSQPMLTPKVTAPGPMAANTGDISKRLPGISEKMTLPGISNVKTPTQGSSTSSTKQADDAVTPLIAASAGGMGIHHLAKQYLNPMLESNLSRVTIDLRNQSLEQLTAHAAKTMDRIDLIKKYVPIGAALVGAVLLAKATSQLINGPKQPPNYGPMNIREYSAEDTSYLPNNRRNVGDINY